MRKWKSFIIILIVAVLVTILSFVALVVYERAFEKTEIYRENSPDNEFVFILYEVGEPIGSFGPVDAQIKVLNSKGKTVDKEVFSVNNDGGHLLEINIEEIRWYDTKLELDLRGADDALSTTYVLEFE